MYLGTPRLTCAIYVGALNNCTWQKQEELKLVKFDTKLHLFHFPEELPELCLDCNGPLTSPEGSWQIDQVVLETLGDLHLCNLE